jgi:ribosomal protein S18 acetylase RimI-like enzyme
MDYVIDSMNDSGVIKYQEEVIRIYRQAFEQAPYNKSETEVASFRQSLNRHLRRPGFHFMIARDQKSSRPVGFTYGYSGQAGQWWHDIVVKAMDQQVAATWMMDNFELVELAVLPAYQGRGIGSALHDRLLIEQGHSKAVLSTLRSETAALHLYRKRGWETLLDELQFPGSNRVYLIMGIDLIKRLSESDFRP